MGDPLPRVRRRGCPRSGSASRLLPGCVPEISGRQRRSSAIRSLTWFGPSWSGVASDSGRGCRRWMSAEPRRAVTASASGTPWSGSPPAGPGRGRSAGAPDRSPPASPHRPGAVLPRRHGPHRRQGRSRPEPMRRNHDESRNRPPARSPPHRRAPARSPPQPRSTTGCARGASSAAMTGPRLHARRRSRPPARRRGRPTRSPPAPVGAAPAGLYGTWRLRR